MAEKKTPYRIDLTAAEHERLQEIARETHSRCTHGADFNAYDWKVMLRRIVTGELLVQERNPYKLPPGLVEAIEHNEQKQRQEAAQAWQEWTQTSLLESVN